ncbi:hypothetical protein IFR04_015199 [Cadophora malorum]|uniref:Uncharacterized protein n=1 Tax=Cadophora malorum TaxID=108018 RepID=A0A8H7SZF4_9HELO|nr:hypothetical protein IFR04_015199 [Cadophora malorum]
MAASIKPVLAGKAPNHNPIPVFEPDWPDTPGSDDMYISTTKTGAHLTSRQFLTISGEW